MFGMGKEGKRQTTAQPEIFPRPHPELAKPAETCCNRTVGYPIQTNKGL